MTAPVFVRLLPDGRELHVNPLTYGRARLSLSDPRWPKIYRDEW